eukprot:jgi/Botrbrau1/8284/Bobra.0251s0013.1
MLNVKRPPSSDLCHGRKDLQRGSSLLPEIRRKFFKSARGRRKYAILKADSVAVSTLRGIALPQGLDDGVLVVGAGIAGLAIAKALQKLEVPTLVLERDAGLRSSGTAISLWPNAFRALQALDCAGALDSSDNLDRMQICTANGKVLIDIPIPSAQEFKGIRRGALLGAPGIWSPGRYPPLRVSRHFCHPRFFRSGGGGGGRREGAGTGPCGRRWGDQCSGILPGFGGTHLRWLHWL